MITENGVVMRTEKEWSTLRRAILKRQLNKGVVRSWYSSPRKETSATFYRIEQTRPFNQREFTAARRKRRMMEKTREDRLTCTCCGHYFGRDARWALEDSGICIYCSEPRTAWQWLAHKRKAPIDGETPFGVVYYEKTWFYYRFDQVESVDDVRYEELKKLYIEKYGGWESIDLEHTSYNGTKWW